MLDVCNGRGRQISTLISDKIDVGSKRAKNRKDYVTTSSGFLQPLCLFHGRNNLLDLKRKNEEHLKNVSNIFLCSFSNWTKLRSSDKTNDVNKPCHDFSGVNFVDVVTTQMHWPRHLLFHFRYTLKHLNLESFMSPEYHIVLYWYLCCTLS